MKGVGGIKELIFLRYMVSIDDGVRPHLYKRTCDL